MRADLPSAAAGCVVEDLDGVHRLYSQDDPEGRILLTEWKARLVPRLGMAQERTFGMIDHALRQTYGAKYLGFHLIALDRTEDPEQAGEMWINGRPSDLAALRRCLLGESTGRPYEFKW